MKRIFEKIYWCELFINWLCKVFRCVLGLFRLTDWVIILERLGAYILWKMPHKLRSEKSVSELWRAVSYLRGSQAVMQVLSYSQYVIFNLIKWHKIHCAISRVKWKHVLSAPHGSIVWYMCSKNLFWVNVMYFQMIWVLHGAIKTSWHILRFVKVSYNPTRYVSTYLGKLISCMKYFYTNTNKILTQKKN